MTEQPIDTGIILLVVGIFYFFAHSLSLSFRFTRIPDVLILVGAGALLGPILGIAELSDFGRMGSVMTVIALAIILFESGTSLRLATLASSASSTVLLTMVTSIVTMVIVALAAAPFLEGNWSLAFLTGAMLCGTSSAVVIPMVQSLKLGEKISTVLVMESALTDVICIVLTFALVESSLSGTVSFYGISFQVLSSLGISALIGVAGGLIWLLVWEKVRKIPNSVFTTIAFAFVLYGISEFMGLSGAIATLAFGVTLANLPLFSKASHLPSISDLERQFYQEIVFLLKTFFFVFLGVSIQISNPLVVVVSLVAVLLIYFSRLLIVKFVLPKEGVSLRDASVSAIMVPKGLAPAVLVSLVLQKGVTDSPNMPAIVYSVIVISIFFTAILNPLLDRGHVGKLFGVLLKRFPLG